MGKWLELGGDGPTHSCLVSPSWIGGRGPQRELLGFSATELLTEAKSEPDSSGEHVPPWESPLRRSPLLKSPMVVGSMGFSIEDAQLCSFSCSSPPKSSSSSKPGVRWSLARVPSATGSGDGSMSSSWRPRISVEKESLFCQVTGPEKSESVCVHLSAVAGLMSDFDATELAFTFWPFTLLTMLSNSWLEILRKTEINTRDTDLKKFFF